MSSVDYWASGPRSVEIESTPTEASRKCFAAVRKESIPSSFSSSSTVEFRGLEGSDTKAENWSATGSRQIAEYDREPNHPVSENMGHPFITSTKKIGFLTPLSPCGRPHAVDMKYTSLY